MIKAKIIADSKNEFGNRITTMVVTFPRFILAEFNTHRMFSRNSASSRAIPFEKMVKSVKENPFIPIAWQKDHKGMQGTEYFSRDIDLESNVKAWLRARDNAVKEAKYLAKDNVTKQLCNRLLEPFMWHTVIVTATEWENFFALRCPRYEMHGGDSVCRSWKDVVREYPAVRADASILQRLEWNKGQAEIHMMQLAEAMWDAYNESTPQLLKAGEWHIPYHDNIDFNKLQLEILDDLNKRSDSPALDLIKFKEAGEEACVKIATFMAARTSYTVVGDDLKPMTYDKMVLNHDKLVSADPLHASPTEHCAKAMDEKDFDDTPDGLGWSGNFRGFIQYRKMFVNENITL